MKASIIHQWDINKSRVEWNACISDAFLSTKNTTLVTAGQDRTGTTLQVRYTHLFAQFLFEESSAGYFCS